MVLYLYELLLLHANVTNFVKESQFVLQNVYNKCNF